MNLRYVGPAIGNEPVMMANNGRGSQEGLSQVNRGAGVREPRRGKGT